MVEKMSEKINNKVGSLKITPEAMTKTEGKILKTEGSVVKINLGTRNGIGDGDVLEVCRKGDALIDPDTGEELGSSDKKIGTIKVSGAFEKYSDCTIVSGGGFKAGDVVKR
ncbi:MAG: hypothetical protein MZV63_63580 [Marinilabiliales bacterium]|nr:hypothetical protein [Marinilabiliales bacterium]